jgi:flagellar biosynthetic protein FlhB
MAFKASKMDPVKGLGRIFGWKGVIELFKALGKFLIVGSVAVLILWLNIDNFLSLTYESFNSAFAHVGDILSWSFISIAAALIIIAAIDVPFQLWDNKRQLKMSRQEIKDEYKQTEGSPEVKGKIRNLQLEAAKQRMMEEVPQADVVVTNPTHYAVALRYDQDNMQAPSVIAKGRGLIAANIREIAAEHNIAQLSSPPLARALYHSTELGQEIPAGLYMAVAQVLAYVYQLKSYTNGDGVAPSEILPEDLSIPDDLRKDD